MNRIHLLSEQVANQIAAGEVIERPASVVKELVENALDAQAARVTLEIQAGGRSLIRVTDDGTGMSRDDALLCLERHATSKIKRAEDLSAMVANGELRYVLYGSGGQGNKAGISNWLKTSCSVVPEFSKVSSGHPPAAQGPNGQQGPGNQAMTLYMCK